MAPGRIGMYRRRQVALKGQSRHSQRLKRMAGSNLRRNVQAALFAGGSLIEVDAALSIVSGGVTGKGHVASKPGEPPNRDTGQLDQSIITESFPSAGKVEVSANAPYAVDQELGNSKLAERPYMRPATKKNRAEIIRRAGKAVSVTVRRS